MLVVNGDGGLRLITQEDHAWLTGDLAARWSAPSPHQSAFVAAARVHDNGWREYDAAPEVDDAGTPRSFGAMRAAPYAEIWRRGIARAAALDPVIGLLVGLHGVRFFDGDDRREVIRAVHADETARIAAVLADLGMGGTAEELPAHIAELRDRTGLLDLVSLIACGAIASAVEPSVGDQTIAVAPAQDGATIDPWPLTVDAVAAQVPVRTIEDRPYRDAGDLARAIAAAPPTTMEVAITPA